MPRARSHKFRPLDLYNVWSRFHVIGYPGKPTAKTTWDEYVASTLHDPLLHFVACSLGEDEAGECTASRDKHEIARRLRVSIEAMDGVLDAFNRKEKIYNVVPET